MTLIEQFSRINVVKFSFSKSNDFARTFARDCGALSMYDNGFGLGIDPNLSSENQLRGVFLRVIQHQGVFLFNLSAVDMRKAAKGFSNYQEAEETNQITEWELFTIISNREYLKNCIFHNGKVQFKKRIIWNSVVM